MKCKLTCMSEAQPELRAQIESACARSIVAMRSHEWVASA